MQKPTKPYDNKRIFWDVDAEKLDFDKKATFIIERVFERGDVEDIRQCRRFYGDEKIAAVLIKDERLTPQQIALAVALFQNNGEDYIAYWLKNNSTTAI
jgi:hypothetical protein